MKPLIATMFWLIALVTFVAAGEEQDSEHETQSVLTIVSIAAPESNGLT